MDSGLLGFRGLARRMSGVVCLEYVFHIGAQLAAGLAALLIGNIGAVVATNSPSIARQNKMQAESIAVH